MKFNLILFLLSISWGLSSQTQIEFKNSSFEGVPRLGGVMDAEDAKENWLKDWSDCGSVFFPGTTVFDIQPNRLKIPNGSMLAENEPVLGRSYVALVTRDDGTVESMCQELISELKKDSSYSFSIFLAKDDDYLSVTKIDPGGALYNFNTPVRLTIWGGNSPCSPEEILYETDPVDHVDWEKYEIVFTPQMNYKFLLFEVNDEVPNEFTNGNLLIDAINHDENNY